MQFINNIKRFWRQWHNKTLALSFIIIAAICFVTYYLSLEISYEWMLVQTYPAEAWNIFVYILVYGIIIYGNITNNNVAYSGILMFVCMITLNGVQTFINSYVQNLLSIFGLLGAAFVIASVVFGVLYYISIYKYINFRSDNFKKCRVYGILFTCFLGVEVVPFFGISLLSLIGIGEALGEQATALIIEVILGSLLELSEVFAALSCIFTVERIKRN